MLGSTFIRAIAAVALLFPVSVLASEADEPYFMGWYLAPESTEAINCRTDEVHTTLSADRNYGACCNTKDSDCRVATACFGTTVLYNDNSTMECSNGNYCMSFSILQSFPSGPSAVHLWCNSYWRAHTVYKELPEPTAAATVTKTKTVHSTVTAAAASCVTDNVAAETGSSDTVESEASNSNDEKEGAGASSKAWVAGAVIGPVAAIGLIGLAF